MKCVLRLKFCSDYSVEADIWSLTSVNELVREGQAVDRWNLLHPAEKPKQSYIAEQLGDSSEAGGCRHRLYEKLR